MLPWRAHASPAGRLTLAIVLACTAQAGAQTGAQADDAHRHLVTANGLLNRGLHELALPEYQAFLEASPDGADAPTARYALGVCYVRLGRYDEGAEQLARVADLPAFAFRNESGLMLGHCLLAQGDLDGAVRRLEKVLASEPDREVGEQAAALLAEADYRAGRHDEAIRAVSLLAQRWPQSSRRPRAELIGAMADMATRRHAEALEALTPLSEQTADEPTARQAALLRAQCLQQLARLPEALRQYELVLQDEQSPHRPDALLGAAQVQHAQGRIDKADQLLTEFEKQYARTSAATSAALLRGRVCVDQGDLAGARAAFGRVASSKDAALHDDAAYWLAKCDLRDDRFDAAAASLRNSLADYPESNLLPEMRYDLGVSLLRASDDAGAFAEFKSFRALFPDHALAPGALHTMATIRHRQGDHEACLELCEEYLADHPGDPDVTFLAGECEFLLERDEAAVTRFGAFRDAHPDDSMAPMATLRLGLALDRLGRFEDAEGYLLEASRTAGDRAPAAAFALGQGYFDAGRWQDAERYLTQFLDSNPDDPAPARLRLGLARQRDGRQAEALEAFDALLQEDADDATRLHATFARAQALLALDRPEEAQRAFEQTLDADPDSRFAPHALESLAALALRRGDNDLAGDLYARAAEASPDGDLAARASFQRLQSLVGAGEHAQAATEAAAFLDHYPDHAMAGAARVLLGVSLSRLGRFEEAAKAFDQLDAEQRRTLDPAMADTLAFETAYAFRALGRTDDAVAAFGNVIDDARAPTLRAHAMVDLAGMYMDAGDQEHAAPLLRQVIEMRELVTLPDDLVEAATYRLGVCTQTLGRHDETIEVLASFDKRWPDSDLTSSADLIRAESLIALSRFADAQPHLQRAVERSKDPAIRAPALLRLAQCCASLTQWPASEQAATEYLRSYAGSDLDFRARFALAWAIENQGRHAEAIEQYRQIVSTHEGPTAARAQFQIGECLFALARHEDAVRELLRVDILYDYPEWSAAALYEAGRCFETMRKQDEARAQYALAAERFPDSDWARLATQRLDAMAPAPLPGRGH